MTECVHCKRRDPKGYYYQESLNEEHYLRAVPFDEPIKTTFIGKYWKQILIIDTILLFIGWIAQ